MKKRTELTPNTQIVTKINQRLQKIGDLTRKNHLEILDIKLEIGKLARILYSRTENKRDYKNQLRLNFKMNANRVYECMAMYRATKLGAPKNLGSTNLIRIGEQLKSKNKAKRTLMRTSLETGILRVEGQSFALKNMTKSQLSKLLKGKESGTNDVEVYLKRVSDDLNALNRTLTSGELKKINITDAETKINQWQSTLEHIRAQLILPKTGFIQTNHLCN